MSQHEDQIEYHKKVLKQLRTEQQKRRLEIKKLRQLEKQQRRKIRKEEKKEKNAVYLSLYEAGLTDTEIGEKVGVYASTICKWRNRQDLKPNQSKKSLFTEEEDLFIKTTYEEFTDWKIAAILERPVYSITSRRRKLKLMKRRGAPWGSIRKKSQNIINLYHTHPEWSWEELAIKGQRSIKGVKLTIGRHLMRVCRASDSCVYKALLPEYEGIEENSELGENSER